MIVVSIYVQNVTTLEYDRIDLFSDETISVVSSIQNVNDIAKTFTDFSQTFTIPASVQNNKIFKHWYDNSNNNFFSTLEKANAYIEIDTILFRKGKVQLESCNILNGSVQDYSITFIGTLGNLKDIFAGLYLKDLTDTTYDFSYSQQLVLDKVTSDTGNNLYPDIYFPLISSKNVWEYDSASGYDINTAAEPIRTNELFPAIRVKAILNMIGAQFGITFAGSFLSDYRLTPLFMLLKNSDTFATSLFKQIDFTTKGDLEDLNGVEVNLAENFFVRRNGGKTKITITPQAGFTNVPYIVKRYLNGELWTTFTNNTGGTITWDVRTDADSKKHSFSIESTQSLQYVFRIDMANPFQPYTKSATMSVQSLSSIISVKSYFPEIKIEDFFSGLLKMFNLTCTSQDGKTYNLQTIENYYSTGDYVDISQYIFFDKTNINRVKTYKKINFEYEKSESLINVGFNSANGIEYGSLFYTPVPPADGAEYNIKLPFETLNFSNLNNVLQVGYLLKTDYQPYIPKPILLYASVLDGSFVIDMTTAGTTFYVSTNPTGNGNPYQMYRPFGQENYTITDSFSINFNEQQSTINNVVCENSLYDQYYRNYLGNIFSPKARLIKVQAILPTSILTSLNLNDRIIIKDARYIINTMTTNLTTGVVQFELLTDFRDI